jgi:hypothetical protein
MNSLETLVRVPGERSVSAGPRAQIADPTLVAALLGDLGFSALTERAKHYSPQTQRSKQVVRVKTKMVS